MKSYKFLLAGLVLCVSQATFAVTAEQSSSIAPALSALQSNQDSTRTQSLVESFITAAANAGVPAADIITQLSSLGIPVGMMSTAVSHLNPSLPSGYAANLSTILVAMLGNNPTASGGASGGLASLGGGFTSGGFIGGPSGAVSAH
jgi:uncharacterized membrane protein YgcG